LAQAVRSLTLSREKLGAQARCNRGKFAPEKTDLRYYTSSQLGQLLGELREERRSYFGNLTYHLAVALFFTGCRFHEVGVRLRGEGVDFAGSPLIFPARDGAPFSNQAFNARIKLACERTRVPVISAHPLRRTAATILLNERGANLRDAQALLGPTQAHWHVGTGTPARFGRQGSPSGHR
jgi:hypothetical protein